MNNQKKLRKGKEKNRNSGITLIALVVTIIVLLILAGISISMLSGDNSILNRATQAKNVTGEKQIQEKIRLAVAGAIANGNGSITGELLTDELDKQFGEHGYTLTDNGDSWEVEVNGVTETISKSGTTSSGDIQNNNDDDGDTSNLTPEELAALETNGIEEITSSVTDTNLKDSNKIKAVLTGEVPLTTEMTYITGTKDTGVVVSIDGNEFVWVPVPVAIASSTPSATGVDLAVNPSAERPMAMLQSGSDTNYQGVLYDFNGTTSTTRLIVSVTGESGYREPAYLNNSNNADASSYNTVGITQELLQNEYNAVVGSIAKYGGFYVGRYELGLEGIKPVSKPASDTVTTADATNSNTNTWYGLYSKCKSFRTDNLTSTMIWGSQYDAMMNWMASTGKTVGTEDRNKFNQNQTTGSKAEDIINNVYDLYGCHHEWTQEAEGTNARVTHGGYGPCLSPSYRYPCGPETTYGDTTFGSRITLYVK